MNSATVLTGKDGCTTSRKWTATVCVIGAKLLAAAYESFYRRGLVANVQWARVVASGNG